MKTVKGMIQAIEEKIKTITTKDYHLQNNYDNICRRLDALERVGVPGLRRKEPLHGLRGLDKVQKLSNERSQFKLWKWHVPTNIGPIAGGLTKLLEWAEKQDEVIDWGAIHDKRDDTQNLIDERN